MEPTDRRSKLGVEWTDDEVRDRMRAADNRELYLYGRHGECVRAWRNDDDTIERKWVTPPNGPPDPSWTDREIFAEMERRDIRMMRLDKLDLTGYTMVYREDDGSFSRIDYDRTGRVRVRDTDDVDARPHSGRRTADFSNNELVEEEPVVTWSDDRLHRYMRNHRVDKVMMKHPDGGYVLASLDQNGIVVRNRWIAPEKTDSDSPHTWYGWLDVSNNRSVAPSEMVAHVNEMVPMVVQHAKEHGLDLADLRFSVVKYSRDELAVQAQFIDPTMVAK